MNIEKKTWRILMCVCTTMPYNYISPMNDAHNVASNTHMRSTIYSKFYHICIYMYTMEDVINLQIHQQHNIYIVWSLTLFRHIEHFWYWRQKRMNPSQSTEIFVHYKVLPATDSLRLTSSINCLPHNIRTADLKLFVITCSKSINGTLCWCCNR